MSASLPRSTPASILSRSVSATNSDRSAGTAPSAAVDSIDAACWSAASQQFEWPAMKIYGDRYSGNCTKVKFVCDRLSIPYAWIEIDTGKRETRTTEFLKLNSAGQVPTVEFDDGRTLAESNAIIRYLARGSDLVPGDAFRAAQMDAWMFWEQNSHEPYVAVCRFHMVYLGKSVAELDPNLVKRGYVALN